jgi:hypothetical protein
MEISLKALNSSMLDVSSQSQAGQKIVAEYHDEVRSYRIIDFQASPPLSSKRALENKNLNLMLTKFSTHENAA